MNLIEAVKSGRPFKRPEWDKWCVRAPGGDNTYIVLRDWDDMAVEAALADDYELKPEERALSREEVRQVIIRECGDRISPSLTLSLASTICDRLFSDGGGKAVAASQQQEGNNGTN